MNKLDFWTPVTYTKHSSWETLLLEKVDSYFYIGGMKARVIKGHELNGSKGVCLVEDKPLYTAWKVATFIIGFIPLLALKYVLRKRNPFHLLNGPYQNEVSRTVHKYPGNLSSEYKALFNANSEDGLIKLKLDTRESFDISIRNQDLFKSSAEVIVNAANSHLGGGGGIDGAIHRHGGNSYKQGHRILRDVYESEYTSGHAALISSGELVSKYKIEKVIVVNGPSGKSTEKNKSELYSCYYNSLVLADAQKIKSIAFPSISTGIFSYPKEDAAEISLKAIFDFTLKNPDTTLKTISIHFQDDEGPKTYAKALKNE